MKRLRRDDGATAVEAALVLPLIIYLVFCAIDFGLWAFANSQAANAARDASRVAIINPNDTAAIFAAAHARVPNVPQTSINVTTACASACAAGTPVTVTVGWHRDWLSFFGVQFGSDPAGVNVSGSSTRNAVGVPRTP